MESLVQFIPPVPLMVAYAALIIVRFENQRWTRARAMGLKGSSEAFGLFVDATGSLSRIFSLAFLGAVWFDFGWQSAVALVVAGLLVSMAYALLSTLIMKGESVAVWLVATGLTWPLAIVLSTTVTWFGMLA